MTRISVYLKSIRTSKYALFEISKIFRNSDFASCAKFCFENNPLYCTTISLLIKQSKTDQIRKGVTVVISKTGNELCPVSALLHYLALRGNKPGPLFQEEDGSPLSKPRFMKEDFQLISSRGIVSAEGQQQLQQWQVSKTPQSKL